MRNGRDTRRFWLDSCIRWGVHAVALPFKHLIHPDDQRQTQEVDAAQNLIILTNVGGLKCQMPIDRHIYCNHEPVTPQPFSRRKIVIHLVEDERIHPVGTH
jgi:hypothetical protein